MATACLVSQGGRPKGHHTGDHLAVQFLQRQLSYTGRTQPVPTTGTPFEDPYPDDVSCRSCGDLRKEWQAQRMRIEEWWPKLDPATQEWLIANNGDVVPTTVLGQIAEAGGDVTSEASSIGDNGPGGFLLSDAVIDWIEETANYETDSDSDG
jgi:hypothetical protein